MATFSGGDLLRKYLAKIKGESRGSVNVGFLAGATYPDGMYVAQVAFWNEYGTSNAPARPFFRTMISKDSPNWGSLIGRALPYYQYDGQKVMEFMGNHIAEQLKLSIIGWQSPGNAAYTIARKGFDKPLIHTGDMSRSTDYEVKSQ